MPKPLSDFSIVVADATALVLNASELDCIEPADVDSTMQQALAFSKDLTGEERATYVSMLPSFRSSLEDDMYKTQAKKLLV